MPPVAAAYQLAVVPVAQTAPKVTDPVPQEVAGVTVGTGGFGFTTAVASTLGVDSQPAVDLQVT